MYQTNLKKQIEGMKVGESLKPYKGYKEVTLRNYASCIGKATARKYSVTNLGNTLTISRIA